MTSNSHEQSFWVRILQPFQIFWGYCTVAVLALLIIETILNLLGVVDSKVDWQGALARFVLLIVPVNFWGAARTIVLILRKR